MSCRNFEQAGGKVKCLTGTAVNVGQLGKKVGMVWFCRLTENCKGLPVVLVAGAIVPLLSVQLTYVPDWKLGVSAVNLLCSQEQHNLCFML